MTAPVLNGLPPFDRVFVFQAQFFDNSDLDRKKGQSEFSVKLFLWCGEFDFDWRKPDWWRVIQLLEPSKVLGWAQKKHTLGEVSDNQLSYYTGVCSAAAELAAESPNLVVKVGHISSPPGKHYFPGQFVYVWIDRDSGTGSCIIIRDDEHRELGAYRLAKKATKARAAKGEFRLDPCGVVERQMKEDKAMRERRAFGGAPL